MLGPWKAVIDGWLEADATAPRKQRHTARRVWQRLVEEDAVDVGESTVRRIPNVPIRDTGDFAVWQHQHGRDQAGGVKAGASRRPRAWP